MAESNAKKNTSKSLQQAMRKFNAAEEYYAKFMIAFAGKARLKLYRKIASLMRNRFTRRVFPGSEDVLASLEFPVRLLINEDLPTLDFPTMAISGNP